MTITESLPKELNKTLNSQEFDDEAGILIESVKYNDNNTLLTFSIRFDNDKEMENQLWQVDVIGVEEDQVTRNWTQSIELFSRHIKLLEYQDIHTELYLNGTTNNSQTLFLDIIQSLRILSNDWDDIKKYLFTPERVEELSQQNYGLFARGPMSILQLYAQCLTKQGIKPIFIGEYEPLPTNKSLKLLQIGESYFTGQTFVFEKIQ